MCYGLDDCIFASFSSENGRRDDIFFRSSLRSFFRSSLRSFFRSSLRSCYKFFFNIHVFFALDIPSSFATNTLAISGMSCDQALPAPTVNVALGGAFVFLVGGPFLFTITGYIANAFHVHHINVKRRLVPCSVSIHIV